jgi:DNA polymerase III delta prime subunit
MSKSNPADNEGPTKRGAIHLVLQGKGGVGKSLVATWLAQYLLGRQNEVRCIDSDPVNRSLAQYAALNADKLDLVNGNGVVERSRFDDLLDRFATEEVTFLLDSGATVFLPLWSFIMEIGMIGMLRDVGRQVYVHCVVCGGDMLNDTLMGFDTLAKSASDRNIVLWLNEYFGGITRDGKTFEEMTVLSGLSRPEQVVYFGVSGIELPHRVVRSNISDGIHLLVHIERRQGYRCVTEVVRVRGYNPAEDRYELETVYAKQ